MADYVRTTGRVLLSALAGAAAVAGWFACTSLGIWLAEIPEDRWPWAVASAAIMLVFLQGARAAWDHTGKGHL